MAENEGNNLKASEIAAGGAETGGKIILEKAFNQGGNFGSLKGVEACKNLLNGQPVEGVDQSKQTRTGMSSCSADGPTPAKKRARFDDHLGNVEKEVPASTEAYFAFLDASWREEALKNPQLTPKGVQVYTTSLYLYITSPFLHVVNKYCAGQCLERVGTAQWWWEWL